MIRSSMLALCVATGTIAAAGLAPAAMAQPVYVQIAPPPPRHEIVPPPRRGQTWVPGHWEWRRNRHVWAGGYWIASRPGYVYRPPVWVNRGGRWEMNRGAWDRDGDGVPNRFDSHPHNPHRR